MPSRPCLPEARTHRPAPGAGAGRGCAKRAQGKRQGCTGPVPSSACGQKVHERRGRGASASRGHGIVGSRGGRRRLASATLRECSTRAAWTPQRSHRQNWRDVEKLLLTAQIVVRRRRWVSRLKLVTLPRRMRRGAPSFAEVQRDMLPFWHVSISCRSPRKSRSRRWCGGGSP